VFNLEQKNEPINEALNKQQTTRWLSHVIANDAARAFNTEHKQHGLTIAL